MTWFSTRWPKVSRTRRFVVARAGVALLWQPGAMLTEALGRSARSPLFPVVCELFAAIPEFPPLFAALAVWALGVARGALGHRVTSETPTAASVRCATAQGTSARFHTPQLQNSPESHGNHLTSCDALRTVSPQCGQCLACLTVSPGRPRGASLGTRRSRSR